MKALFWIEVLKIVRAHSKNPNIVDTMVKEDIVKRCAELSENYELML